MKQEIHTQINWLDREQIVQLLEGNGMACYDSESTDNLRETLRQCVQDGDIILDEQTEIELTVGESFEDMGIDEEYLE